MIKFVETLADTTKCRHFKDFMVASICAENLYFWLDVEDYKRCPHGKAFVKTARKLHKKYLKSESKMEVDLPPKLRDEIVEQLDHPTPTLFNKAQRHVFRNMLQDQFPRYLKSNEYRTFVNNELEAKKKAAKTASLRSTMNRRGLRKKSIQADFLHLAGKKFNNVDDVLAHAVAARYFKEYLETAHIAEALHFYMEVSCDMG